MLPLFVVLLFYALYFLELMRARLRVQEMSRAVAWEVAAQPLTDYATGRHDEAFSRAATQAQNAVRDRYSRGDGWPGGFVAGYENLDLSAVQQATTWTGSSTGGGFEPGQFANSIFGALQGPTASMLEAFGFSPRGVVESRVSLELKNQHLPQHFFEREQRGWFRQDFFGGAALSRVPLRAKYTLMAADWHLGEGEDVLGNVRPSSTGQAALSSAFHKQISRMTFFGLGDAFNVLPGLSTVAGLVGRAMPDPTATYLVSRNYGPRRANESRECDYLQNYPEAAKGGINNLARGRNLDHDRPACFDTAPFRDQASYQDSLYVRLFQARGPFFMGCKRAQADDPASDRDTSGGDQAPKVDCG